jgi:tripartite-type tricarboxylate transporter receptor subunit TctC
MARPAAEQNAGRRDPTLSESDFSESGRPNFTGGTWFALMAPAGTPAEVISELSKATAKVLASADFQKSLEAQGVISQEPGAEPFKQFLSEEIDKWHKVAEQIKLVPQ